MVTMTTMMTIAHLSDRNLSHLVCECECEWMVKVSELFVDYAHFLMMMLHHPSTLMTMVLMATDCYLDSSSVWAMEQT